LAKIEFLANVTLFFIKLIFPMMTSLTGGISLKKFHYIVLSVNIFYNQNHIFEYQYFKPRAQPGGRLRGLKPEVKVEKKDDSFNFLPILCIEPDQNVTATLSYCNSVIEICRILAREELFL